MCGVLHATFPPQIRYVLLTPVHLVPPLHVQVLTKGYGFAINANVKLDERYGRLNGARAFAATEEGTGNVIVYPFPSAAACTDEASKWWVCWVAWDTHANEIGCGGVGFAQQTARSNGLQWLAKNAL